MRSRRIIVHIRRRDSPIGISQINKIKNFLILANIYFGNILYKYTSSFIFPNSKVNLTNVDYIPNFLHINLYYRDFESKLNMCWSLLYLVEYLLDESWNYSFLLIAKYVTALIMNLNLHSKRFARGGLSISKNGPIHSLKEVFYDGFALLINLLLGRITIEDFIKSEVALIRGSIMIILLNHSNANHKELLILLNLCRWLFTLLLIERSNPTQNLYIGILTH